MEHRYRDLKSHLRALPEDDSLELTFVAYITPTAPAADVARLFAALARTVEALNLRTRVVDWYISGEEPRQRVDGKGTLADLRATIDGLLPQYSQQTTLRSLIASSRPRRAKGRRIVRTMVDMIHKTDNYPGVFNRTCFPQRYLMVQICYDLLASRPSDEIVRFVEEMIGLADASGLCRQAFCEADWANTTSGGRYFGSFQEESIDWHRMLEHAEWVGAGESRLDRLRGVYWGVYMDRDLAARASIDDLFLDAFRRQATYGIVGTQNGKFLPNGVFFRLSDDPLTMVPLGFFSDARTICNAVWLRKELRARGVM